ncbi:hypothetical protein RUM44_013801 [Polyplax serrata]|uniref:Uncharacterized protein n=1 Tax=Polyplax serrata TaxID=468196 RepID=A0ABR1BF64_POLSC
MIRVIISFVEEEPKKNDTEEVEDVRTAEGTREGPILWTDTEIFVHNNPLLEEYLPPDEDFIIVEAEINKPKSPAK